MTKRQLNLRTGSQAESPLPAETATEAAWKQKYLDHTDPFPFGNETPLKTGFDLGLACTGTSVGSVLLRVKKGFSQAFRPSL